MVPCYCTNYTHHSIPFLSSRTTTKNIPPNPCYHLHKTAIYNCCCFRTQNIPRDTTSRQYFRFFLPHTNNWHTYWMSIEIFYFLVSWGIYHFCVRLLRCQNVAQQYFQSFCLKLANKFLFLTELHVVQQLQVLLCVRNEWYIRAYLPTQTFSPSLEKVLNISVGWLKMSWQGSLLTPKVLVFPAKLTQLPHLP